MKNPFGTIVFLFFGLIISNIAFSQGVQLNQPSYTACPNQIVTVTATWPNVGGVTYSLASPNSSSNPQNGVLPSNVFTINCSIPTATNVTFTLSASGTSLSGQVSSTITLILTIIPPAPLNITNQVNYCAGATAQIIAPLGGSSYNINSTCFSASNLQSNIINIGPLSSVHNCTYLVTSVGSCTMTGTTTINVAPITPVTANSASNVCQGEPVQLSSTLTGGSNFQWYDPYGSPLGGNSPNYLIGAAQPTSNGTYTITVNLPFNGILCPRTAVTQVNVVSTSAVNVAASPANILCQGDKLTFNAGAGGAIGWTWAGPQNFNASTPNPVINPVNPLNSGVYTVTALFTNNVITCTTAANINISIITVNQPVISLPGSICQGGNLTISASAVGSNGYNWYGPNSFSSVMPSNLLTNVQANASGIYYVTAKYGLGTTTCAATSSAQLNVVPVNTISIIPPTPVCQPDNGALQASAIGANQYIWQGPSGFTYPGPNAIVYNPTPSNSGVYTVTAYFVGTNLTCSSTNTAILTVNPILTFNLIPRQQVCYNTPVNVIGPAGATGYTWTSSTGYTSNQKDLQFASVQPPNSGTYTLNVTLGPCLTSASTTILVLDPIQFTLSPLGRNICRGDTTVFEVGATGGSENYAYLWNPTTYLDYPTGPKKVAVPLGSVIYNVVAHDIACPNYTVSHSFTVNVKQPPMPNLELARTRGCAPLVLTYDPKTDSLAAFTTFDFGGNLKYQPSNNVLKNYTLDQPGSYTLVISSKGKNGCSGTYTVPYPLIVDPKPGSVLSWSPEIATTTDEIIFDAGAQVGPITRYYWEFSGGLPSVIDTTKKITAGCRCDTSIIKNPARRYENVGIYPVMLVSYNTYECSDTVVKFMQVIDEFKVYIPNSFTPNGDGINDYFMVKGSGMKYENFTMELSDRWGNQVYFTKDITAGWDGKINGKEASNGIYIYKVKVVGMNGEGRKEYIGYFNIIK